MSWQVNHSLSFNTDSQLDHEVKDALLCDTFNLINVHACDRKKVLEEDKRRVKERLLQANQTPRESRYCCSPTVLQVPSEQRQGMTEQDKTRAGWWKLPEPTALCSL